MDAELRELYQQVILDHNKSPRNFRVIEHPSHSSDGYNPLCGDIIHLYLTIEDGIVMDISFQGSGCAISKASTSLMSSIIKGKTIEEAKKIFEKFQEMITGKLGENSDLDSLGKLAVLAGVKEFPARVKCASLAWHTLINAINEKKETVTTE
jgi:nitrogen fixation protein NifU and related proteins